MAKSKKKQKVKLLLSIIVLAVIVIGILAYLISIEVQKSKDNKLIAEVNNDKITLQQLELEYSRLPDEYKTVIVRENLLDQLIDKRLLLQQAELLNLEISDEDIQQNIDILRLQFDSEDAFQEILKQQQYSIEGLRDKIEEQLIINTLINETIISKLEITDNQIVEYYEENKEVFATDTGAMTFDEAKNLIRDILIRSETQLAFDLYVKQLREKAEIVIFNYATNKFEDTGDEICMEDGKPIIRFYTSSQCDICNQINLAFQNALMNFDVKVYSWNLDSDKLPKEEIAVLKKYNSDGAVPAYVFGCKYVRVGNAYSGLNLNAEEVEFRNILSELV